MREPLLSAVNITKRFGTFAANDAIDLDIYGTETHALLGENGAGKSTLVKIIYGLLQPTSGELRFMGRKVELAGPAAARALGIGMVFQHFSLFENLTVAENVALGLSTGEPFNAMSKRLADLSHDYGLPLEPAREVWRLSVGERQRIEIVRALMQNPKLLILDEPTSVLTPQECDQLFVTLRRLKNEGRAILYISHKLDEVKALCETATILRGGKKISTCDPRLETAASLARMMVGADIGEVRAAAGRKTGIPRFVIRDPHPRSGRPARGAARRHLARGQGRRDRRQSPASPATARTSCSPPCRANGNRPGPTTSSSTATQSGTCRSTTVGVVAPRSCRRSGSVTAPHRA